MRIALRGRTGITLVLLTSLGILLAAASSVQAGYAEREDELIARLNSPHGFEVAHALVVLEKDYPQSTKAFPVIKQLLRDPRRDVHCKAARVLGKLHADVNQDDITAICALLKSKDTKEVQDGLIALRGLKAPSAVPEVLLVLKSDDTHNIRDACWTLAVLAGKDVIPSIEPLLQHPDPAVQKDASIAIFKLREKS